MESAVSGLRKIYIEERVQRKHLWFHMLSVCREPREGILLSAWAGARWDRRGRMKEDQEGFLEEVKS